MSSSQRIVWVDICRVLGMLSIMVQHTPTDHPWATFTTRSAVAFFFLVSGYFLLRKTTRPIDWLKRGGMILLSFAAWICIGAALHRCNIFQSPGIAAAAFGLTSEPFNLFLWFLKDLGICCIVAIPFLKMKPGILLIAALAAGMLFEEVKSYDFTAGGLYLPHPRSLSFFLLGMAISRIPLKEIGHALWSWKWAIIAGFAIAYLYQMAESDYLTHSWITLAFGIGFLAVVSIGIEKKAEKVSLLLARAGSAVFWVYVTHAFAYRLIDKCLEAIGYKPGNALWFAIVPIVFVMLVFSYRIFIRIVPSRVATLLAFAPHKS